ncbi:MAG: LytTR family transcriptional regulator DNA-binding domain-containing protein [Bacteroidia bacterium]
MTHDEKIESLLLQYIGLLKQKQPLRQSPDRIELPARDGNCQLYSVKQIISLSGSGTYTIVHLLKGGSHEEVVLCHNLGYWEKVFNDFGFLRLHRSRLINPDFIIDFNNVTHYLELPFLLSFKVPEPYRQTLHIYFHNRHNTAGE